MGGIFETLSPPPKDQIDSTYRVDFHDKSPSISNEQSLKEAVLKKAFQMTTVKDEKWVEEEMTTPKKRVFANGVQPI